MDWRAGCTVQFVLALRSLTCSPSAKGLRCQVFDLRPCAAEPIQKHTSKPTTKVKDRMNCMPTYSSKCHRRDEKRDVGKCFAWQSCVILCARLCDLIRFDACQFFGQLRWVAADHLGLLRPAKTSIWSGDADWDANLRTCAPGFFRRYGARLNPRTPENSKVLCLLHGRMSSRALRDQC